MSSDLVVGILTGTIGGAVLTAINGHVTAHLARRGDLEDWLREQRLKAYAELNASVNEWTRAYTHRDEERMGDLVTATKALADRQQVVRLLAPDATAAQANELLRVVLENFIMIAESLAKGHGVRLEDPAFDSAVEQVSAQWRPLSVMMRADVHPASRPRWWRRGSHRDPAGGT